ncbi:MAG: type III pantothenate kinase [Tenuifilaceae bacterium]|nr:type III pantothenate kinase [Tenuifilaceae bacterium]
MNKESKMPEQTSLVVDIGNTLTKIAVFKGNHIEFCDKIAEVDPNAISNLIRKYDIERAIISSVGEIKGCFDEFLSQQVPTLTFSSQTPLPIKSCYKTSSTLGPDRLAAVVGASVLYENQNVLSIDSGTAITYDLITSGGEYLGGAISPGIDMRFKALNHFTAKLPLVSFNTKFPLIGDTTETSIKSGVLNGVIAEVDSYIDHVRGQYSPLVIVFTGGDSFFFDKNLKNSIFVQSKLVLLGLNRILEYNENLQ